MLVHLGRPGLRAHARVDPGVPEEARHDLDHPQLRARRAGRSRDGAWRFGATCAAYERRVTQATVTLEHPSEGGPFHNAPPIVNVRHFPRLAAGQHDAPAVHELVRAVSRDRSVSEVWEGAATLELFGAPHEEIDALAPVRLGRGYRFTFAYTVDDLETVKELRS